MIKLSLTLESFILQRPVEVRAALPYGVLIGHGPFKTLWALHCAMRGGDMFFDELLLGDHVDRRQVAVIAPCMGNGYFVNSPFEDQGDFLRREFKPAMQAVLPLSQAGEDNFLLGVSMGAFSAAQWALAAPDEFSAAALISGVFDLSLPVDERARKSRVLRPIAKIFYDRLLGRLKPSEIAVRVPELAHGSLAPRLGAWCGQEDYISLRQSEIFVEKCRAAGYDAALNTPPGFHDIPFWRAAAAEAVDWLLEGAA